MKLLYWIYGFVVLAIISGLVLVITYRHADDFIPKITVEQTDSVIVIDTTADSSNSKQENHENTQ